MATRFGFAALVLAATAIGAGGCGKKGPPRPPEARGPLPPTSVSIRQIGSRVVVRFTVPEPRGLKESQELVRAELIRVDYLPGTTPPMDTSAFRIRGRVVAVHEGEVLRSDRRGLLEDLTVAERAGYTLRYGVRLKDRIGRASSLVAGQDLVPLAPLPPPTILETEPTADGMRLRWNTPADPARAFYNVYRWPANGEKPETPLNVDPIGDATYLDSTAIPGTTYVYEVRAATDREMPFRESDPTQPVEVLALDRFPPAAPEGLLTVQEGSSVRLFWDPSPERDLLGYRVYRRRPGEAWVRIGPDGVAKPSFLDDDVNAGDRWIYRVTAIDRSDPPNESVPSDVLEILVVQDPLLGREGAE